MNIGQYIPLKVKTFARKIPAIYETVQSMQDRKLHRQSLSSGTFSQHGEDVQLLHLLEELGARGPYLDVGSNHPFRLSNTYLLYRSGWRGVCIDPLPRFERLYKRWRPMDTFLCAAIGERTAQVELFQFEWDPLSTLDPDLATHYVAQGHRLLRKVRVPVKTLDQVLVQAGVVPPLSVLSIDIEGHELQALQSFDLANWAPSVICVEAVTPGGARNGQALQYLSTHGYRSLKTIGFNVVYVRE